MAVKKAAGNKAKAQLSSQVIEKKAKVPAKADAKVKVVKKKTVKQAAKSSKKAVAVKKISTVKKVEALPAAKEPAKLAQPVEKKSIEASTGSKAETSVSEQMVDLKELLEAGAHFGHQARRWNPKMKPYIFTTRDNVHVFDLAITAQKLQAAMEFITRWVSEGREIVFVGCKRQAQAIVKEEAMKVGAPYVTERWLGGMLTNWDEMERRLKRLAELKEKRESGALKQYTKKERVLFDREIARLDRFFGGLSQLTEKPQALFVVDSHKELVAVKEANIAGIPVVGMVDTNGDPDRIDYIIPINDDAVRAIKLVVTKIAQAYAAGKALQSKVQKIPEVQKVQKGE